jgi:hypothetical protein
MLLSDEFDIVQPMFSLHIYQDMTRYHRCTSISPAERILCSRPLCDYYINTSHNT